MADSVKTVRKPFALPKAGVKQGVCVDTIDLGQNVETFSKEEPKLVQKLAYVWQVKEINPDTGKRFEPSIEFTVALGKKANLPKFFVNVRGSEITRAEEEAGVEWSEIDGMNALLTLVHKESKTGNKYAVISNISALPEDSTPFKAEGYKRSDHWAKKKEEYAKAVAEFADTGTSKLEGQDVKETLEAESLTDDLPF